MELAIEKAKTRSIAAVELYNCSHIGRLGEYVEMAAVNTVDRAHWLSWELMLA